jgi:hypothetical protein
VTAVQKRSRPQAGRFAARAPAAPAGHSQQPVAPARRRHDHPARRSRRQGSERPPIGWSAALSRREENAAAVVRSRESARDYGREFSSRMASIRSRGPAEGTYSGQERHLFGLAALPRAPTLVKYAGYSVRAAGATSVVKYATYLVGAASTEHADTTTTRAERSSSARNREWARGATGVGAGLRAAGGDLPWSRARGISSVASVPVPLVPGGPRIARERSNGGPRSWSASVGRQVRWTRRYRRVDLRGAHDGDDDQHACAGPGRDGPRAASRGGPRGELGLRARTTPDANFQDVEAAPPPSLGLRRGPAPGYKADPATSRKCPSLLHF